MQHRRYISTLTAFSVLVIALCGCDSSTPVPKTKDDDSTVANTSTDYTAQIKTLYEKAKGAGEQVPEDVFEWAKADVKKIGAWDYRIISFSSESKETMLAELNKLGSQRWECFWVEELPEGKRFYMKKAVRSYIQMAGKASKFIPTPASGE